MDCIAHRGFAAVNPENTLEAVRRAASAGADRIEVDVRRCGSGELVTIHDPTVDRVSDGSGAVADHSLAELRALEVLGTGAGVPTLPEVVDACPAEVGLDVELKQRGLAAAVVDVVAAHDGPVRCSSFDPAGLAELRDRAPELDRALLFGEPEGGAGASETGAPDRDRPGEDPLDLAADLECAAIHPHHAHCLGSDLVDRAHAAGLAVNAWTVRSVETARALRDLGVDGLIADAPACCLDGA